VREILPCSYFGFSCVSREHYIYIYAFCSLQNIQGVVISMHLVSTEY